MRKHFAAAAVLAAGLVMFAAVALAACFPLRGLTPVECGNAYATLLMAAVLAVSYRIIRRMAALEGEAEAANTRYEAFRDEIDALIEAYGRAASLRPDKDPNAPLHPRFAPDAQLLVDADNGDEQWSGQRWNEYAAACEDPVNGGEFAVRLRAILERGTANETQTTDNQLEHS